MLYSALISALLISNDAVLWVYSCESRWMLLTANSNGNANDRLLLLPGPGEQGFYDLGGMVWSTVEQKLVEIDTQCFDKTSVFDLCLTLQKLIQKRSLSRRATLL